jgi:phospholipase/carboxylesterase
MSVYLVYLTGFPVLMFFSKAPQTYSYGPLSGNKPEQLFLMFHGGNGVGRGIMEIAVDYAPSFPNAIFVAVEGELSSKYVPYYHNWFNRGYFEKTTDMDKTVSFHTPYAKRAILKAMDVYDISDRDTYLIGFSQGAVISLHTALRMDKEFGAIISIAGYVAGNDIPNNKYLKNTPIYFLHGNRDITIPPHEYIRAISLFKNKGYRVGGQLFQGIGHEKHDVFKAAGLRFLKGVHD